MRFDAIVIGTGQGGRPLAFRFVELGWQVALARKDNLGGTCINTGCTPTKTMVHRAQVALLCAQCVELGRARGKCCAESRRNRRAEK